MSKNTSRTKRYHPDNDETTKMVSLIEEKQCRAFMVKTLDEAVRGRKYLSLRQAAKETRFLWILAKWRDSLVTNDPKEQEYWGAKIEEFCMERAKAELKIDGMEGANLLMEVVAKALIDQRQQRQIANDPGNAGTGSPTVR